MGTDIIQIDGAANGLEIVEALAGVIPFTESLIRGDYFVQVQLDSPSGSIWLSHNGNGLYELRVVAWPAESRLVLLDPPYEVFVDAAFRALVSKHPEWVLTLTTDDTDRNREHRPR